MAVDKLAELVAAARALSPDERRRLIGELDALDRQGSDAASPAIEPLAALLAASGTVHSDYVDLSTNKYAHVAAAALDQEFQLVMRRVFVDTGGFVALLVAEDRMHSRAQELFDLASRERWSLITTNAVVIETYSVLLARARDGRRAAVAFLDAVDAAVASLAVESVRADDEFRAAALVRTHTDKSYSLCDALSFVVMERLGVSEAISFDRHFREYGRFVVLQDECHWTPVDGMPRITRRCGVRLAANHSGDSDSTASLTGQLLGTAGGWSIIPDCWLRQLELREVIETIATDLATWSGAGKLSERYWG